jgi:hypothetical protein
MITSKKTMNKSKQECIQKLERKKEKEIAEN